MIAGFDVITFLIFCALSHGEVSAYLGCIWNCIRISLLVPELLKRTLGKVPTSIPLARHDTDHPKANHENLWRVWVCFRESIRIVPKVK